MATWNDPVSDLRTFLADGPYDNLVKEKAVLGIRDSSNRTFYTFEDRLTTSGVQTSSAYPLRCWVNDTEWAASGINVVNHVRGEFQLTGLGGTAPASGALIKAGYFYQQHFDSELSFYLVQAAQLVSATVATSILLGLQQAALNFAGAMAHERLAVRWQQRKSDQFMLQEAPQLSAEYEARINFHRQQAQEMYARGLAMRKDYYDLSLDRGRRPSFGIFKRRPNPWTPNR